MGGSTAGLLVLGDAVSWATSFVDVFVGVYILLIFATILLSWIRLPYSLQPVRRFLYDVCEPYLAFFRRLLPFLRIGPIDFSAIVAILALELASQVVISVLD